MEKHEKLSRRDAMKMAISLIGGYPQRGANKPSNQGDCHFHGVTT